MMATCQEVAHVDSSMPTRAQHSTPHAKRKTGSTKRATGSTRPGVRLSLGREQTLAPRGSLWSGNRSLVALARGDTHLPHGEADGLECGMGVIAATFIGPAVAWLRLCRPTATCQYGLRLMSRWLVWLGSTACLHRS
jgi:hypothetical protein